jgi:hypothetical protein
VEAELAVEELGEVVAHAQAVVLGGGLVVPLLDPGDELEEAGEHGEQALARPALAGLAIHVQVGEGLGPLQVIPAGPAVHRLAVVVRLAARVADEALLGDIELAAQAEVAGLEEVGRLVLGRHRDGADRFARVLAPLEIPALEPLDPGGKTSLVEPQGGEERDREFTE